MEVALIRQPGFEKDGAIQDMRARLCVEVGDGTPRILDLLPGTKVTLGRDSTNAVVLPDEHASRWHAEIVHADGRWLIGSIGNPVNGTLLNGQRIHGHETLQDGHEIGIGDTRLRFSLLPENDPAAPPPRSSADDRPDPALLEADELTSLCQFMNVSLEEDDPRVLVRRALETVVRQTQATFAGFLSLDPKAPLPWLIVPEQAQVDPQLSRQLTRQVQQTGRPAWLAALEQQRSESLDDVTDALCLPLRADGPAFGALHVYKLKGLFAERHLRFGEALAGSLAASLHRLRVHRSLEADNVRLRGRAPVSEDLIGRSAPLRQLRDKIDRAAARPATVLIRGESGAGKELVALALHRKSSRRDGPLVVVNCAAIASTLLEAELFGHRKGAFTGADRDRAGLFEQADEGILFLDEVGELPLDCQAKLLRVIEGKGFRPVGATAEVQVDVRIIAATSRDLEQEVKNGAFRPDLLFRLQVIPLVVPPLREHPEDIQELAEHYLDRLAVECHRQVRLTDAALIRLQANTWPGNVRQLWAVLESAVTMTDGPAIDARDLPLPPTDAPAVGPTTLNLAELETWAIREALQRTRGNVSRAAKLLGIVRDTLASKMKRKGIEREQR